MSKSFVTPALFAFLRELRANNERDWFQAEKKRYERDVLHPALAFVEAMAKPLEKLNPWLAAEPRVGGTLFRIHRDVRFSKDKSPYKTHVGMWFYHRQAGRKADAPGFYVHLEPDNVLLAHGVHMPQPPALAAIRQAMADAPDAWLAARDEATRAPWRLESPALKRPPKGFDAASPAIEDIKRTSFTTVAYLGEADALASDFMERAVELGRLTMPLGGFLAPALGFPW